MGWEGPQAGRAGGRRSGEIRPKLVPRVGKAVPGTPHSLYSSVSVHILPPLCLSTLGDHPLPGWGGLRHPPPAPAGLAKLSRWALCS